MEEQDEPAGAAARVLEALRAIERARDELARAREGLYDVRGMAVEFRKLGTIHKQVRAAYYQVSDRAVQLRGRGALVVDGRE